MTRPPFPPAQRRRFARVPFVATATLAYGGRQHPCTVDDLSLKGALLTLETPPRPPRDADCVLELALDDGLTRIRMNALVAHAEDAQIGLTWRAIDLDSLTHLRRLLELNLGDAALLQRELSALLRDAR